MAALFPLLQEILPMLMPGSVHITKADELRGPPRDVVDEDVDEVEDELVPVGQGEAGGEAGGESAVKGDDVDKSAVEQPSTQRPRQRRRRPKGTVDESGSRSVGEGDGEGEGERAKKVKTNGGSTAGGEDENEDEHDADESDYESEEDEKTNKTTAAEATTLPHRPPPPPRPPRSPLNGVSLRDAIINKSSSLCASVLTVKPQCSTVVFHNGEQDAIIYAVSGTAVFATLPEDFDEYGEEEEEEEEDSFSYGDGTGGGGGGGGGGGARSTTSSTKRRGPAPAATHTISAGDFAFIPAWTEHQVRNEGSVGEAVDVVWVVVRNAGEPTVVPLQGWGGEQAE